MACDRETGTPRASLPGDELDGEHLPAQRRAAQTDAGIARRLRLSRRTVETHVRHILRKLSPAPNADHHRRVRAVIAYLDR
jgi:hypothetical protein